MIRLANGTLECYRCRQAGKTHQNLRQTHVLSGKRTWIEVSCRRCGSTALLIGAELLTPTRSRGPRKQPT